MDKVKEFNRKLEEMNLVGYWGILRSEVFEPASSFEPCIWRWKNVKEALHEVGEVLGAGQSFRRFIAVK